MLKRQHRLKDRRVFRRIYRQGRQGRSASLTVFTQSNQLSYNRLAVVVSTKVSKKATVRNRIRRRLQAQLKDVLGKVSQGQDILISVRNDISRAPSASISSELALALSDAGLLEK